MDTKYTSAAPAALTCIGHITHDKVITPDFEAEMPGGTAFYFAKALKNFAMPGFRVVTSIGESETPAADELRADGIDVTVIPSPTSIIFENRYGHNINERTQRVLAKAAPFTVDKLQGVYSRIFHLGTLMADDFDLEAIKLLASRGIVSVDVQGYLRKVVGEDVVPVDYEQKREAMPYISVLKANEKEMETLTGTSDPREAARILADWGCPEVTLTLGDHGSLVYTGGEFYEIPAIATDNVVDATGCGDTYSAGYLYCRSRGIDPYGAGLFASAMCTIKLGRKGPFSGTPDDVVALLAANGYRNPLLDAKD